MPLLDVFWSMLWFFIFVAWIWTVIAVIGDIFRSKDMGGGGKAFWVIFVIIVPWLGVLSYLLVRGPGMAERSYEAAAAQEQAARSYIQEVATVSPAEELQKLNSLRASGVITDAEFEAQKAKLLA